MDEIGGVRRGPPKLREILRRQRQDSEVGFNDVTWNPPLLNYWNDPI